MSDPAPPEAMTDPVPIAFDFVHGESEYDTERWYFGERHSCNTLYVGPCRACAQDRVVHDAGDEQPDQFAGRRGMWLVGGGRRHNGTLGGVPPPQYDSRYSQEVTQL